MNYRCAAAAAADAPAVAADRSAAIVAVVAADAAVRRSGTLLHATDVDDAAYRSRLSVSPLLLLLQSAFTD